SCFFVELIITNNQILKMNKSISTLFVLLFAALLSNAQPQSKLSYSLVKKMNDKNVQGKEISVFVKGDIETIKSLTSQTGGVVKYATADIAAIRIPVSGIELFYQNNGVVRMEEPDRKLK